MVATRHSVWGPWIACKPARDTPYRTMTHKIFTGAPSSPGATNGTANIFPALATADLGFVHAVWSDNTNILYYAHY